MQVLNQETIVGNGCWRPTASSYSDQLVNLTSNTLRATCCNQSISLCWFVQLVCKTSLCNWGLDWFATGCTLVIFLHKIKAVFVNHVSNLQIQLLWRWQLTASGHRHFKSRDRDILLHGNICFSPVWLQHYTYILSNGQQGAISLNAK